MRYLKASLFVAALAVGLAVPATIVTTPASSTGASVVAHADSLITSGTIGQGCHWALTDGGKTLTLSGKDATLPDGSLGVSTSPIETAIDAEQDPTNRHYADQFHASNVTKLILQDPLKTGTDAASLFGGFLFIEKIDGLEHLNTSAATTMLSMFDSDTHLTSLDLSHFDTQNVTNMGYMFFDDEALPTLDLSPLDTQNVTDMSYMFNGDAHLTKLAFGDNFDTHKVEDMSYMFDADTALPALDLSKFDTSQVTDMRYMFSQDVKLTSLLISSFRTPLVTDMSYMFDQDTDLTAIDVSHFDTANVTNMVNMFADDPALTSVDVSHFNTANVKQMHNLFDGDSQLADLDLSHFNTAKVTDMNMMFHNDAALTKLDLSSFDTTNVTNMNSMFAGTSKLTDLDLSSFTTPNVIDFGSMFDGAASLTKLDLSKFVTDKSGATDGYGMENMFANMTALKRLNIANFDSRSIVTAEYIYYATTDHLFQNDHQLSELTVGPNLQVMLGTYDNYVNDPTAVHSPELPAITPSTTYTGKWRAVAGGTTTAPAGKTAYTSDDLVKLYAGDTRPTAVTTYVWEPLVTLGQPVTIHYVDQRGKSLRATSELSGNVGSTYTIKPAKIRDYQFVKVSQGALKGTYSAKPQTVTLVYRKTTTPPVTPTTPSDNSNTNTSNSSSSTTSNSDSSTTSNTTPTTPAPTLKKGQAITAVKKLALYRTPNFSKHTRKFYYAKQPRTKRPQFLITGVAKSRAGHLRYLVRDVTPNNKRKGQTGYVTAQAAFTVKTYYQHAPKRVKLLTGTNAYREVALKHRVKHFKRGRVLRVKKVVTYHLTTRFMLTNGTYITGNKAQVLAQ